MKTEEYTDELDYGFALNKIYDKKGFQGIIEYVKDELEYGDVTIKHGVYCITTGGWSEDEFLIHSLISPVSKFHYHYCGYLVGGAFYFVEDREKRRNIEIIDMDRFDVELKYGLTSEEEEAVIRYLQAYHDGNVELLKAKR